MRLLTNEDLTPDQVGLVDRIYEYDETLVYAPMGAGKSVCTLTALADLISDGHIRRVLVIAPLKPCLHVWAAEHAKWVHLKHLRVSVACGTPVQRHKAVQDKTDIVVLNIENVCWFFDAYGKNHGFDSLVIDELSKFGDSGNKSVKKLRRFVNTFKHRVGLTGTPVHEGFEKLYAQVLMLDGGKRLGTSKQGFLDKYFTPLDFNGYNYGLRQGADREIIRQLHGLVYAMPDYRHELPELVESRVNVTMPEDAKALYKEMVRHSVINIGDAELIAENAAVLSGKLEQMANGFIYDEEGHAYLIHTAKEAALQDLLQGALDGCQLLLFYQYQHDKDVVEVVLNNCGLSYATLDNKNAVSAFLSGAVQVLLLHPKSAGHGLNLHTGGACNIVCYAPIWSNDQYKQLVARLWRRNAKAAVHVWQLVAVGTIDEEKLARVEDKSEHDIAFKRHVARLR